MTFDIEALELAQTLLEERDTAQISQSFSTKIEASQLPNKKMVNYGKQSFIKGMHQAYADHRPFTLSPDMIWLLICQGFSKHVNKNATELRDVLVDHQGKKELIVRNDCLLADPEEWKKVIPAFIEDIKESVKGDLVDILSPNFSTTTATARIACEITIMDTFKSFFEYTVLTCICGIPKITLEGTLEDWIELKAKTSKLATYQLNWWVDSMLPILDKIIETKKGHIDKPFWRNMYKVHTPEVYGATEKITGWITTFFPYDRFGLPTKWKNVDINDLPDELTYTNFKWVITDGLREEVFSMQLVAGFVGLSQCPKTLSLTPQIGWLVCEAMEEVPKSVPKLGFDSVLNFYQIDEMPREILKYKQISNLGLSFNGKVKIPYSIGKVKITYLYINGNISEKEKKRLIKILPFTLICFNENNEDVYFPRLEGNYFYKSISKIRQWIGI